MKYMGSKARFAKYLLPIILKDRKPEQYYVEPFAGGMNMVCEVNGNRIANDINFYLMAMWEALVYGGWIPPEQITKEQYKEIRLNQQKYPPHIIGWVAFNCSYSGVFWGSCAGITKTKIGTIRDYQKEAIRNITKQISKLKGVKFKNRNYWELKIPKNSVVYCDPPYENTSKYTAENFDHVLFWNWCRKLVKEGHTLFISEYKAPEDFKCVWEKDVKSSLRANGKVCKSKLSTEKLFVIIE